MFRRRRVHGADQMPRAEPADDLPEAEGPGGAEEAEEAGGAGGAGGSGSTRGPWDVADAYAQRERIDLGSLRIPAEPGLDIQVNFSGDQAVAVMVMRGESVLQLQAFAAPKRTGLWDDIRHELIEELAAAGGRGEEAEGPFGIEVRARVPAEAGGAGGAAQRSRGLLPARFLGADGPRWFLRGVISGPAALHANHAKVFEDVFADTVVVRGDHPMPPRDLLELRLPAEAQEALEEQLAQTAGGREPLNPFVRGPEITEIR